MQIVYEWGEGSVMLWQAKVRDIICVTLSSIEALNHHDIVVTFIC